MFKDNLKTVQDKVQASLALRKGPKATGDTVTIVAVTKNHPAEVITEALDAGLTCVGENRVQEAQHKKAQLPPKGQWHLIGHLQSNKVKHAVEIFDLIESVDSAKIMALINKEAEKIGKVQEVLLQINEAGEEQKTGLSPEDFKALVPTLGEYPHVLVRGVMVIAQATEQLEETRPVFAAGYKDFVFLQEILGTEQCHILSMGMTHDYGIAIEEGANMIRVGTGLFGARDYSLKF